MQLFFENFEIIIDRLIQLNVNKDTLIVGNNPNEKNFRLTYDNVIFVRQFNLKIMETKLTLRLNDNVIERAKIYANSHKISLSKMVESYLDSITKQKEVEKKTSITPLVESLSGVIDLPSDFDYKKDYRDYLEKKYK